MANCSDILVQGRVVQQCLVKKNFVCILLTQQYGCYFRYRYKIRANDGTGLDIDMETSMKPANATDFNSGKTRA